MTASGQLGAHRRRAPRPYSAGLIPSGIPRRPPPFAAVLLPLIPALASLASTPASTTTATTLHTGASQPVAAPLLPLPFPHSERRQLVASAILVLLAVSVAALPRPAVAWYWALFAGPLSGWLMLFDLPPRTSPAYGWFALLSVWIAPLVAIRYFRTSPSPPQLVGERIATLDDLSVHRLDTWPARAPHISAGVWWQSTRRCWQLKPRVHPIVYGLDAGREGRHSLLVVPTGLGKGLWTATQLLTWNGSAIVNDLKGDTYPITAGWRATLGPVYALNAAKPIHRFDPAADAETEDDLRPLAHAVCDDPADRNYWSQHAERILVVLMLAAKHAHEPIFPFLARAIHGGAAKAQAMVAEIDSTLADRIRPESQRTFASAWETLATRCASLLSPNALATLAGSDFAAADLLNDRATLYLQIPEARLADLRPFLRLLWTSLMQQLATQSDLVGGNRHPLLLVLDEAGLTPFPDLPDYLVTLRSRRISCAVLVQALSQLRAAYGQQADTILANCSIQIYARTEDLATMEYVSRRIGYAEEIVPTVSETKGFHGVSTTHGQHRRFRPLVSPQQLRILQDNQVAAFLPASPPAALARMDWRQHSALTERSMLHPPEVKPVAVPVPSPIRRIPAGYVEPD